MLSLHAYNDGGLCERNAAGALTPAAIHNALRHWQIYEALPEEARLPLVYSEASAGNGYATVPDEMWLNDLIEYGQVVKSDPYLLSACAFQCGGSESNCYQILPAYGVAIVESDWTPDEPEPDDGFPFVVVSHLVPHDVTPAEYDAVQAVALPAKQDVLFSADIARANALRGMPGSKVIVWGQARWSDSIVDFLSPAAVELRSFAVEPPPTGGLARLTDARRRA